MSAAVLRPTMRLSALPSRQLFSTSVRRFAESGQKAANTNPQLPSFSLKHLASTPRGRFYLIAAFSIGAFVEGYAWATYGPKIMGWDKEAKE